MRIHESELKPFSERNSKIHQSSLKKNRKKKKPLTLLRRKIRIPTETMLSHSTTGLHSRSLFTFPHLKPRRLNHSGGGNASVKCAASKWAERLLGDFQFLSDSSSDHSHSFSSSAVTLSPSFPPPIASPERQVTIPIDFYRVLGAETHFLGDGIRRAYEARVSKPPQYGFSQETLISRRLILQAACETLADHTSRREYNQSLSDDEDGTILTQVPFDKVMFISIFAML